MTCQHPEPRCSGSPWAGPGHSPTSSCSTPTLPWQLVVRRKKCGQGTRKVKETPPVQTIPENRSSFQQSYSNSAISKFKIWKYKLILTLAYVLGVCGLMLFIFQITREEGSKGHHSAQTTKGLKRALVLEFGSATLELVAPNHHFSLSLGGWPCLFSYHHLLKYLKILVAKQRSTHPNNT